MSEGKKDDETKAPIFRAVFAAFPRAMEAVARAGAYGSNRYSWDNWRNVSDGIERYSDAMARHMLDEAKGNRFDADSGLPIAWSTAWNCLARLELMLIEEEEESNKKVDTKNDWLEQVRPETTPSPATTCKCGKTTTQPRSQGPTLPLAGRALYDWRRTEEVWQ